MGSTLTVTCGPQRAIMKHFEDAGVSFTSGLVNISAKRMSSGPSGGVVGGKRGIRLHLINPVQHSYACGFLVDFPLHTISEKLWHTILMDWRPPLNPSFSEVLNSMELTD